MTAGCLLPICISYNTLRRDVIIDLLYGAKVVAVATNGPLMDPLEILHSPLEILHCGLERGL